MLNFVEGNKKCRLGRAMSGTGRVPLFLCRQQIGCQLSVADFQFLTTFQLPVR